MLFEERLCANKDAALALLGYGGAEPDAGVARLLDKAAALVEGAVTPRWAAREFELEDGFEASKSPTLKGAGLLLPGEDIARHLAGCSRCLLFGVTLGAAVEQTIRAAEAADIALAALADSAASALAEQYADVAEESLRRKHAEQARYLTGRYSPGYGDFPIALQGEILRLLDGPRAIGLTVSASGLLLPRKSITAALGVADSPVAGTPAGCDRCALLEKCGVTTGGRKSCWKP